MVEALNLAVCNCAPALTNGLGHIVDLCHSSSRVCQGVIGSSSTSNACGQCIPVLQLERRSSCLSCFQMVEGLLIKNQLNMSQ